MVAKEINLNTKSIKTKQCFLGFRKDTMFGLILKRSLFLNNKCKFKLTKIYKKISKIITKKQSTKSKIKGQKCSINRKKLKSPI